MFCKVSHWIYSEHDCFLIYDSPYMSLLIIAITFVCVFLGFPTFLTSMIIYRVCLLVICGLHLIVDNSERFLL